MCTSFHFPDSELYLLNGLIFILIYSERRDTENQQYRAALHHANSAQARHKGI